MRRLHREWWVVLVLGIALLTAGCGDDDDDSDDDDNDTSDDTTDDDTADDDTADDDSGDDDTGTQDLPPGYAVEPADVAGDVGLSRWIRVTSTVTPIDRETFALTFKQGETVIDGEGHFSRAVEPFAGDAYYFFPVALFEPATEYTVELTIDGTVYTTTFTTVAEPTVVPFWGNSDIPVGKEPYAMRLDFTDVVEPAPFADAIRILLALWKYMVGPAIVAVEDGTKGTLSFTVGAGDDFTGDENLEQDFAFTGYLFEGNFHGPYFKRSGPITITYGDISVALDLFDISIEFAVGKDGEPSAQWATISGYTDDCESLKDFLPDEFQDIVDEVCDDGALFLQLQAALDYNPLTEVSFPSVVVSGTNIWYTFAPGMWTGSGGISPSATILRFFQGGELVLESPGYDDNFNYYVKGAAADPSQFSGVQFYYPPAIDPGTFDVDFHLGMYCDRRTVVIPAK